MLNVYFRQGSPEQNCPEWVIVDLQGNLETRQAVPLSGKFIGDLHFTQKVLFKATCCKVSVESSNFPQEMGNVLGYVCLNLSGKNFALCVIFLLFTFIIFI